MSPPLHEVVMSPVQGSGFAFPVLLHVIGSMPTWAQWRAIPDWSASWSWEPAPWTLDQSNSKVDDIDIVHDTASIRMHADCCMPAPRVHTHAPTCARRLMYACFMHARACTNTRHCPHLPPHQQLPGRGTHQTFAPISRHLQCDTGRNYAAPCPQDVAYISALRPITI